MSKQVLSVADFATLLNIVNKEIKEIEWRVCEYFERQDYEKYIKNDGEEPKLRPTPADIRVREQLDNHQDYKDLLHLKEALQQISVEIETPEVKIEKKQKSCPNSICAMH